MLFTWAKTTHVLLDSRTKRKRVKLSTTDADLGKDLFRLLLPSSEMCMKTELTLSPSHKWHCSRTCLLCSATVVCAWGEDGAAATSADGITVSCPVYPPEKVVDTLGAGNCSELAKICSLRTLFKLSFRHWLLLASHLQAIHSTLFLSWRKAEARVLVTLSSWVVRWLEPNAECMATMASRNCLETRIYFIDTGCLTEHSNLPSPSFPSLSYICQQGR